MPPSFPLHSGRYRDLASAVSAQLEMSRTRDPLQPWGAEVIVASSGVAEGIARQLATGNNGIAGLQLQTIEVFARRVVNAAGEFPRVASEGDRRLAMRSAIRSIDEPVMQSRGVAAMLERSYRDMRDSGLTLADFRNRSQRARLRNGDRTRLVVRAWSEYERLISLLGAVDPASILVRAAQLIDGGAAIAPQIVAGFYDLTGAQRSVIEALVRAGKVVSMHVPAGDADAYAFARPLLEAVSASAAVRDGKEEARPKAGGQTESGISASPDHTDPSLTLAVTRVSESRWSVTEHERRDVEIEKTCAAIGALLDHGMPSQAIGIVARSLDPADVHLFNRFSVRYGFRTSAPEELPLVAHRIGRAIVCVIRLRERGFQRNDVLDVVRDGFSARTRINVDKADQEARRMRISGGTSGDLGVLRSRSLAIGDYIDVVAELEELTARIAAAPLRGSEWSELLVSISSRFAARSETDLVAAQKIDEIATLFARADRMNVRFDAAAVIDAIEQTTIHVPRLKGTGEAFTTENTENTEAEESEAVSASPTKATSIFDMPVVWLGDVMRFRGRSFEHLFAVRMQDEIFPQRRIEDPLLPDVDRTRLGIREIGDGRDEERFLFQLMLDGSSSIHFSFAGSDGFGSVLRPSQLLKNFVIEQRPDDKHELLKDFSKAIRADRLRSHAVPSSRADLEAPGRTDFPTSSRQLQLLARAGSNGPFDGFIATADLRQRFARALEHVSPTQLEDFGECPQKFLFKFVLKCESVDDPDRELQINPRDKGSLDHRILEHFYSSLSAEEFATATAHLPQLPPSLLTRLEEAIDLEFDRFEQESPAFNRNVRDIERRATRRILRDFVVADLSDLAESDLRPRWFEYSFGDKYQRREGGATHPEPFVITAAGVPIAIEGQIDRIDVEPADRRSTGQVSSGLPSPTTARRYRIVDYKSGKAPRHAKLADKIDRGVRLQLPLYAMAVSEFFAAPPAAISGTIKPLVPGDKSPASFAFALADHLEVVRTTLDIFASSILGGSFPAFPDEREIDSCKYCPVNHSCRTKHDAEEAYAVTRSKDARTLLQTIREQAAAAAGPPPDNVVTFQPREREK